MIGLLIATGVTWRELAGRPDGKTHLTFFDSGSRLIETADGRFVLIGGGDSAVQLSQQLGRRLPLLHRQLDWLIIADTRQPQVRGLIDLSDRYRIGGALIPSLTGGSAYRTVLAELQADGVELVQPRVGQGLRLGPYSRLVVLQRDQRRISLLLIDGRARIALLSEPEPSPDLPVLEVPAPTVLAVHQPTSAEWLAAVRPWLSIATGRARDPADWLLSTERYGWIELISDGELLWVQSQVPVGPGLPAR